MFNFGDPVQTARMLVESITGGPGLPDKHIHEMDEGDLRELLVYLRAAVDIAEREAHADVCEVLEKWYFRAFREYCRINEEYVKRVLSHAWRAPFGKPEVFKHAAKLCLRGELEELDEMSFTPVSEL